MRECFLALIACLSTEVKVLFVYFFPVYSFVICCAELFINLNGICRTYTNISSSSCYCLDVNVFVLFSPLPALLCYILYRWFFHVQVPEIYFASMYF